MADLMNQEYDHLFKVLLLGDSGTGKSSLILRYTEDTFNSTLVSSIGVDFKVKKKIIDGKIIRIQIVRNKNIIIKYKINSGIQPVMKNSEQLQLVIIEELML